MLEGDRPRTGGEYSDHLSTESRRRILGNKPSQTSLWSSATAGSGNYFFPRWSWEPEVVWPDERYQHKSSDVVYEVCVKCLEERVVVVQPNPDDTGQPPQALDTNPYRYVNEDHFHHQTLNENPYSGNGVCIGLETGLSRFSSTETLLATSHANSRPPSSRAPSRKGPSSGEATIVWHGITSSNFSSTETLHPPIHDPVPNRMPPRRGTAPVSGPLPLTFFPAPPQRSSTMPASNQDMTMSGARMDELKVRSVDSRDPMYRVSRGGRGWV